MSNTVVSVASIARCHLAQRSTPPLPCVALHEEGRCGGEGLTELLLLLYVLVPETVRA